VNARTFRRVNLNLLIGFAVLMRERSVTRTAMQLSVSQPAISAAISKMRSLFNDRLFTRTSNGIAPTRRAREIYRQLLPSLELIENVLRERHLAQADNQSVREHSATRTVLRRRSPAGTITAHAIAER
jgi:DNA-binding transcriptional LysR family regulator